jgi:DNA-binding transcriptional LysR family regulator
MSRPERSVTLHLLECLDHLLTECNVSRAAMRAGISQSTMSTNLAELRRIFGDPLLVQQGRRLVPTPRAEAVAGQVRLALRSVDDALQGGGEFRPERAQRGFTLLTNDFVQSLMMRPLVERWSELSARLELAVLPIVLDTFSEQLGSGLADVAILGRRYVPPALRGSPLFTDRWVLLARRNHPILGEGVDLRRYLSCAHILVSPSGRQFPSGIDEALKRLGHARHLRVCLPQYLTAAQLTASTDLVATVPCSVAARVAGRHNLLQAELPFPIEPFELWQVWHERSQHDKAHQWLREELRRVAASVGGSAEAPG